MTFCILEYGGVIPVRCTGQSISPAFKVAEDTARLGCELGESYEYSSTILRKISGFG